MKKLLFILIALGFCIQAFSQSKSDSLQIKEAALNYVEGFYTGDFKRVEKAVHPELAKRIVVKDESGHFALKNMGASDLVFSAARFKKADDQSGQPFKAEVIIYDISKDIATVKLTQNKMQFFDYLHFAKINGEWKIVNVLWARTE
jgi:hypothetical protein